jgi:hypothetical protein
MKFMKRNQLLFIPTVLCVLVLASCAGLPNRGGGGGGGGNNTSSTLTLTMISETRSFQTDFTILAFSAQITSLTLNPQIGSSSVSVPLSPSPYTVDFNRLTTDSVILGTLNVPSQTGFGSMSMALSNITITIAVPPTGTAIGTCLPGSICEFNPAPQLATITGSDFPKTFIPSSKNTFYLSVRPQAAVTSSSSGLSVDFSKGTGIASFLLPRLNQASGTIDTIQDFTGTVSAISSSSITVTSGIATGSTKGVPLIAKLSGATFDDDSPSGCPAKTISGCVSVGSIVSMDSVVNTDGSLTATEIDLLDPSAVDSIEGTIFSTAPGSFSLVLTDKQVTSGNATLTAANIGDIFTINGLSTATFSVDTKNLSTATPAVPVNLFASTAGILSGQTIRMHVSSASGTNAAGNQTANVSTAQLRFSRFTATKSTASAQLLTISSLGAIYQAPALPVVQVYPVTVLDKFTDITSVGGAPGTSLLLSVRALFLNAQNNFYATEIRDQ